MGFELEEADSVCIVRLSTSAWHDKRGVYLKKSLVFLRRRCKGFPVFEDDCSQSEVIDVLDRVLNIDTVPDGIYKVTPCNITTDFESGYVDDWDYRLDPIEEG